eukprot:782048-Rhodomonas_salina.2
MHVSAEAYHVVGIQGHSGPAAGIPAGSSIQEHYECFLMHCCCDLNEERKLAVPMSANRTPSGFDFHQRISCVRLGVFNTTSVEEQTRLISASPR